MSVCVGVCVCGCVGVGVVYACVCMHSIGQINSTRSNLDCVCSAPRSKSVNEHTETETGAIGSKAARAEILIRRLRFSSSPLAPNWRRRAMSFMLGWGVPCVLLMRPMPQITFSLSVEEVRVEAGRAFSSLVSGCCPVIRGQGTLLWLCLMCSCAGLRCA
jgi:hypothetical protein